MSNEPMSANDVLEYIYKFGYSERAEKMVQRYFETPSLAVGDRVSHRRKPEWGIGTISELSVSKKSVYVVWDDGEPHSGNLVQTRFLQKALKSGVRP